jgi:uncharacterized protein YbjT (DUF2867 family)
VKKILKRGIKMKEIKNKILIAGATGYLGKYVARAFKRQGYYVRILAREESRLKAPGPFTAPALSEEDYDELFLGEITRPETLNDVADGMDIVFSSVGISRQRDGLTFDQVDYQGNKNLIDQCLKSGVKRFVYVSMLDADKIMELEITRAHEKVVMELESSPLEYTIVRPSGYYSDMGSLFNMAYKGRVYIIGKGLNSMNPIHGQDLADVCVEAAESNEKVIEAGGPDIFNQRDLADLAFEVTGKSPRVSFIPFWIGKFLVGLIRLLSRQYGDLADFIVTASKIDSIGPKRGKISLREYFEELKSVKDI